MTSGVASFLLPSGQISPFSRNSMVRVDLTDGPSEHAEESIIHPVLDVNVVTSDRRHASIECADTSFRTRKHYSFYWFSKSMLGPSGTSHEPL